jgi:class 3 adenylate cyclase/tetratricopeptide (TPR) repeat protein
VSCGTGNSPAAKFCRKCGSALAEAQPSAAAPERDPHDYTPRHLADKILRSKSALEGERKQVTVLFADVKGSMELAEQVDPEEWHQILDRFFEILADGVHRFEGTVNQYTGDGIMALFGAPIAHEDHAQRACYAALHLREALRSYADQLRLEQGLNFSVRMGINSGEVVVGRIGDDLRMDYTAQGQVVNLAARIEQLAEPGRIYTAESTAGRASGYFRLRDLGQAKVKGSADPVHVFDLEDVGEFHTRFDVSRARGLAKFVGRDREMFRLEAALERARARGQPQLVGIVAEAGTGKSRLAYEFCERCRASRVPVDRASCPPHGRSIPLGFHMSVMRSTFGILDRDDDETARNKVAGQMVRLDPSLAEDVPFMLDFLGIAESAQRSPVSDPEARQREFLRVVERIIRARLGEVRIWLLEDLHWIDPASEAVDLEVIRIQDEIASPVLKLMTFRPEYRPPHADRPNYEEIRLKPLGPKATAELLADLLGPEAPAGELEPLVQGRAGGNPFFLEEIVQSLVESGHLEGSRGAYRLVRSVETIEIPSSVQAVLAARIDRLSERAKQVLYTAAVVGGGFPLPLLEGALAAPAGSLDAVLYELASADFIYQEAAYPEVEYAFKHPLTREVAYGAQLSEQRRRSHRRIARLLEERYVEKLDEHAALLAHHWEQAGEALEAARWHARAAGWVVRSDEEAARSHWVDVRRLLAPLEDSPEKLGLDLMACGQLMMLSWELGAPADEIEALFAEGKALAERIPDPAPRTMLQYGYASYVGLSGGDVTHYVSAAREAVRLAEATGDRTYRLVAGMALASALSWAGNLAESLELMDECVAERPEDLLAGSEIMGVSPWITAVMFRNWPLGLLGRLDELDRGLRQATELTREHRQLAFLSWGLAIRVLHGEWSGETATTLASARQGVEVAERVGTSFFVSIALGLLGDALRLEQCYPEALEVYQRTLDLMRSKRVALQWKPVLLSGRALVDSALGGHEKAIEQVRSALEESVRGGNRVGEGVARLTLARVLLATGDPGLHDEVERIVERAEALCEETGMRVHLPPLLEVRATLADRRGDPQEARQRLRDAHRLYTEMGATGHAERVARELGS